MLRWLIQRRSRRERMAENIDVFDVNLADEQIARISTLDTGASLFFDHRDPAITAQLGGYPLG